MTYVEAVRLETAVARAPRNVASARASPLKPFPQLAHEHLPCSALDGSDAMVLGL